jgi:hypothetical protein
LDKKASLYQLPLFLIRRFGYTFAMVYATDYPCYQLSSIFGFSMITMSYIAIVKPFITQKMNVIEFLNELILYLTSVTFLTFSDAFDIEPEKRYLMGYAPNILLGLFILTNMIGMIVEMI